VGRRRPGAAAAGVGCAPGRGRRRPGVSGGARRVCAGGPQRGAGVGHLGVGGRADERVDLPGRGHAPAHPLPGPQPRPDPRRRQVAGARRPGAAVRAHRGGCAVQPGGGGRADPPVGGRVAGPEPRATSVPGRAAPNTSSSNDSNAQPTPTATGDEPPPTRSTSDARSPSTTSADSTTTASAPQPSDSPDEPAQAPDRKRHTGDTGGQPNHVRTAELSWLRLAAGHSVSGDNRNPRRSQACRRNGPARPA
jgi:hypothetical protein